MRSGKSLCNGSCQATRHFDPWQTSARRYFPFFFLFGSGFLINFAATAKNDDSLVGNADLGGMSPDMQYHTAHIICLPSVANPT